MHLTLDDAWNSEALRIPTLDFRKWGSQLRFSAPRTLVESFYAEVRAHLAPFVLYGSGDFHHLTALWLRAIVEPITVISFDNHPDWDIRPPKWGCGSWVNRALELDNVPKVSVWGCGNFECWWPWQIFGNRRAEGKDQLEVHPWADERPPQDQARRGAILRANWRERFSEFARQLQVKCVYVTIDLDCLQASEAVTNWENGRFTVHDLEWALQELRQHARVVGGDICGTYSPPVYARATQRIASEFDHPKLQQPSARDALKINVRALRTLWPILTERDQHYTGAD